MEISPKRILYLDEVRSTAILLVVLGHIIRYFPYSYSSWLVASGIFSLTRIGVPLFFTVSGALLLTRKYEIKKFLGKRFKRVFLPLLFWIIVYIIVGILLFDQSLTFKYVMDTAFGVGGYSSLFWFIWSLIGVYLLIPVISSFIREEGMKGAEYLILITIILSVLFTIGFFDYPNMKYNFKVIFNFFPVLGYFIMGSYLHNKEFDMSKNKLFAIGIVLFIIGIIGHFIQIYFKGLGLIYLMPIDFFNIFVICETVGLFLVFKYADVKMLGESVKPLKERRFGKLIVLFSGCSFGIYFSHYLILQILFNNTLRPYIRSNLYINYPLTFIIILLISWALVLVMSKIPILKIGSGRK